MVRSMCCAPIKLAPCLVFSSFVCFMLFCVWSGNVFIVRSTDMNPNAPHRLSKHDDGYKLLHWNNLTFLPSANFRSLEHSERQFGDISYNKKEEMTSTKKWLLGQSVWKSKDDETLRQRTTGGKRNFVMYDEMLLLKRIQEIHTSRYTPPHDETCVKRLPQAVILGMRKCGTQELIDFLSMHPNIVRRGKPVYEINCFLSDKKLEKCKSLMPCSYSDQITMTKSSIYFTEPSVPERLYKFNNTLKMILLVREPVQRLVADYSFEFFQRISKNGKIRIANITSVYAKMASLDKRLLNRTTGQVISNVPEVVRSTYDIPMHKYLRYFKRKQILIIESTELKTNPLHVLRKVESFLGLKHEIRNNDLVFNEEKGFYCVRSDSGMNCYGDNRGRNKMEITNISRRTVQKLDRFFRSHNDEFFRLIGRKYDW